MSEHFRALFVVLFLAAPAYILTRATLARVVGMANFQRRWAAWLALTLVVFVSQNQWLYVFGTAGVLWIFMRYEPNPMALFVMVLLVAPPLTITIPGFGVVNYLAELTHARLLALLVLLPAAVRLARDSRMPPLGSNLVDRLVLGYAVYVTLMQLRETTVTDTLRTAAYVVTDSVLVYYVASRALRNRTAMREVLMTFVISAAFVAFVAVFEVLKSWLLYSSIADALGASSPIGHYLRRDGFLRPIATAGHSIALGYFLVVAVGALLFVAGFIHARRQRLQLWAALAAGLLASLARAPWLAVFFVYLFQGAVSRRGAITFVGRTLALIVFFLVLLISPFGPRIIALLPYVGTIDSGAVDYREQLLSAGLNVFARSPWTGSVNYLKTPEMLAMIQGEGIVDMVNTYLAIALQYGAIGLALFVLPFGIGLKNSIDTLRRTDLDEEIRALATVLAATTLGVLLMIYTVSFITIVPTFAWLLLGMTHALPAAARPEAPAPLHMTEPNRT